MSTKLGEISSVAFADLLAKGQVCALLPVGSVEPHGPHLPLLTDVINDDLAILHLQYSTQWDSLAHVGQLFDADGVVAFANRAAHGPLQLAFPDRSDLLEFLHGEAHPRRKGPAAYEELPASKRKMTQCMQGTLVGERRVCSLEMRPLGGSFLHGSCTECAPWPQTCPGE